MRRPERPDLAAFDRDLRTNEGYLYTTNARLSSRLATQRHLDVICEMASLTGRAVLDLGCGDGTNARCLWDRTAPRLLVGLDTLEGAVRVATARTEGRPLRFLAGDAHRLPFPDDRFDVALLQGMLHHVDDPRELLREALRVAREVVVLEPNGYNLGLKVIEKLSRYHREHHERSYAPHRLARWVQEAGGRVLRSRFAGLVPMFCPDWLARTTKAVEGLAEALPVVPSLGCAVVVLVAARAEAGRGR